MKRSHVLLTVVGLVLISFLFGFFLRQRMTAEARAELDGRTSELAGAQLELAGCRAEQERAGTRDLATRLYLQVNRNNFDIASELSTRLFDSLRRLSESATDEAHRNAFETIIAQRDAITSQLAQADPAARRAVEDLLVQTFAATGAEIN